MKIAILFFLIGAIAGGYAMRAYDEQHGGFNPRPAASRAADSLSEKLRQWRLSPDEVKADLARTGQIVRANAVVAGSRMSDARIAAVVKAKFLIDRDLSARDIAVQAADGRVTLTGTVPSADLAARAVALALDTDGVRTVEARLAAAPRP